MVILIKLRPNKKDSSNIYGKKKKGINELYHTHLETFSYHRRGDQSKGKGNIKKLLNSKVNIAILYPCFISYNSLITS